ncbi:MAG: ParB N-terminal domain-containing protein, partial [Candidatus Lutacidiplasmatales archaeon]
MSRSGRFALLDVGELKEHEEVEAAAVESLVREIEKDGVVREPIWVAEGSHVILNGHHRFAALLLLGVARVPVWLVDYEDASIKLERWKPGPQIHKEEVVRRGREGKPFPPKTTRHSFTSPPPHRPTPLSELRDA